MLGWLILIGLILLIGPMAEIINIYPELERLVENWAKLSPKIRSDIIEMSKEQ